MVQKTGAASGDVTARTSGCAMNGVGGVAGEVCAGAIGEPGRYSGDTGVGVCGGIGDFLAVAGVLDVFVADGEEEEAGVGRLGGARWLSILRRGKVLVFDGGAEAGE